MSVFHYSWLSVLATPGSMTSWRQALQMTPSNHYHKVTCESLPDLIQTKKCVFFQKPFFNLLDFLCHQECQEGVHCGKICRAAFRPTERGRRSGPAVWCCEESWPHFSPAALRRGGRPGQTAHAVRWTGEDHLQPQGDFHTDISSQNIPCKEHYKRI